MNSLQCTLLALALLSSSGAEALVLPHGAAPLRNQPAVITSSAGTPASCSDGNGNAVACSDILYYRHRVLSNPLVWAIFWTGEVNQVTQQQIGSFYQAVTNSEIFDWIIEYDTEFDGSKGSNQRIGRGVYGGAYTISPGNTSTSITDGDIQQELEAQFNAGNIPQPDNNSIFMVYFPAGYSLSQSNGDGSCTKFCAYHGAFLHNGQDVFYGVFPDLASGGCQNGCGSQSTTFKNLCSASTHELLEATTDAETGIFDLLHFTNSLAWYAKPYGAEIGDMCNQYADTITSVVDGQTYTVQQMYSQATKLCQTSYHFATDYQLYANPAVVVAGPGQTVAVPIVSVVTGGSPPAHTLSLAGSLTGVTAAFDKTTLAASDQTYLRFSVDNTAVTNSVVEYVITAQQTTPALYTARTAAVLVRIEPPPTGLTLTGATDGGKVRGVVPLHAAATPASNTALDYVALYIDSKLATYATPAVDFAWNVSGLPNGSVHTVEAYAQDSDGGNAAVSISVTVANPPAVAITSPTGTVAGSVAITASATAPAGTSIASVEFKVDGAHLATVSGAGPYSVIWDSTTATIGAHTLTAVATDADGTSATSAGQAVTVASPLACAIVSPAANAVVAGTKVPVTVTATPLAGQTLSQIALRIDGGNPGGGAISATSPLHYSWDTTASPNGSHSLVATATLVGGLTCTASETVFVRNGPSVSLTAPAAGTTVSGSVTLSATATAPGGTTLANVEFFDGGRSLGKVSAAPYTLAWSTAAAADGAHSLTAVATDADGSATTSAAVAVIVVNPPSISIVSPSGTITGQVTISARASPPAGGGTTIASVEFKVDGAHLATVIGAGPYSTGWDSTSVKNGAHALSAVVTDADGATATSAPVSVTVANPSTCSISAPASNAILTGASVAVTVVAMPAAATTLTGLALTIDGASPGAGATSTTSPLDYTWNTAASANGPHTLRATGTFSDGSTCAATAVTVAVGNPPAVSITSPGASATVSGASASLTATALAAPGATIASVELRVDGARLAKVAAPGPYTAAWDLTAAAGGAHALTAVATDSGGLSATSAAVAVTVEQDDFTVTLSSASTSATAGGAAAELNVKVSAAGLAPAAITLSLGALPAGVTGTFSDNPVNPGNAATLTLRAAGTAAPAAVDVAVTGAVGSLQRLAHATLNVVAPSDPTVAITSPADGATVSGTISVGATATVASGSSLSGIVIYADGVIISTSATSPATASWDTSKVPAGSHTLVAKATDSADHSASSATVTVTVAGSGSGGGAKTGCSTSTSGGAGALAGLLALLMRRRRN